MGSLNNIDIEPAVPHIMLGWPEFREGLEGLDLVRTSGDHLQPCGWIFDHDFGDLRLRKVGNLGIAMHGERTPSRINTYREELIWICLGLSGSIVISQNQHRAHLNAGDFVMIDAMQTYSLETPTAANETLWVGAPRTFLARHVWDVDELLGVRINGGWGIGQIAARTLHAGLSNPDAIAPADANRVSHGIFDVLGAAVDDCRLQATKGSYRDALVRRIKAFIDAHIDDANLTVQRIADAQCLSARYLAKAFEGDAQTVSGWIWNRRLERCHATISESDGCKAISEIAYDHGFKNVSHFSRAFRKRYGVSPSEVMRGAGTGHH